MSKTDKTQISFDWKKWFQLEPGRPVVARHYPFTMVSERDYDWYNWKPYLQSLSEGAKLLSDFLITTNDYQRNSKSYLEALRYWLDSEQYSYMFANELRYLDNFPDVIKLQHVDELVDRTQSFINHSNSNNVARFMYIMLLAPEVLEISPDNVIDYLKDHPVMCYGNGEFDNELAENFKKLIAYCKTDAAKKFFDFIINNAWIPMHRATEVGL